MPAPCCHRGQGRDPARRRAAGARSLASGARRAGARALRRGEPWLTVGCSARSSRQARGAGGAVRRRRRSTRCAPGRAHGRSLARHLRRAARASSSRSRRPPPRPADPAGRGSGSARAGLCRRRRRAQRSVRCALFRRLARRSRGRAPRLRWADPRQGLLHRSAPGGRGADRGADAVLVMLRCSGTMRRAR